MCEDVPILNGSDCDNVNLSNPDAENLISGLMNEIIRVSEIAKEYENFPGGKFAAAFMRHELNEARQALKNGDTIAMIRAFQTLKDYEL